MIENIKVRPTHTQRAALCLCPSVHRLAGGTQPGIDRSAIRFGWSGRRPRMAAREGNRD